MTEKQDKVMATAVLRHYRNAKLQETDIPWGLADFKHPDKEAWFVYRQALRDITKAALPTLDGNNLQGVDWPQKPVALP